MSRVYGALARGIPWPPESTKDRPAPRRQGRAGLGYLTASARASAPRARTSSRETSFSTRFASLLTAVSFLEEPLLKAKGGPLKRSGVLLTLGLGVRTDGRRMSNPWRKPGAGHIYRNCAACGRPFRVIKSQLARRSARYCTVVCFHAALKAFHEALANGDGQALEALEKARSKSKAAA